MPEPRPSRADTAAESVNRSRADLYARLMEAQDRIAQDRYDHGVSDATVQAALDAVDERLSSDARREDLYLAALAVYVEGARRQARAPGRVRRRPGRRPYRLKARPLRPRRRAVRPRATRPGSSPPS